MAIRDYFTTGKPKLTPEESADFDALQKQVDTGLKHFRLVGLALARIREKNYYRLTHDTFEEFVKARWNMGARRAAQLIDAATAAENLDQTPGLPEVQNERQVRPLAGLQPHEQTEAWKQAAIAAPKDDAGQPIISGTIVAGQVKTRRTKKKTRRPKPIRFRLPGGLIIFEPRTADDTVEVLLDQLVDKRQQANAA